MALLNNLSYFIISKLIEYFLRLAVDIDIDTDIVLALSLNYLV